MVLLTSVAVVAASPLKSQPTDNSSGYSTYIVAFKDGQSAMAENQVQSMVDSFNGQIIYKYSVINGWAVTIPDNKVDDLKALDNVKYVEKDQEVKVLLDKAVPQIGADQVWATGYTGKGVKVCVIDTGVDASHPDLNGNKVVGWVDYVNGRSTPYDDHGHGTHVSSTIAGTGNASSGQYKGVAPEASLMVAKVLSAQGSGSNTNILKGMDWAVKNGAQVISMSLGSSTHSQASDDAVANAVKAGVTVVIAAGNSGPNAKTVACPGDSPDALTVGASDRNDAIASFSSRGPNRDGTVKPDVTNMGVSLVAAKATGTNPSKGTQYYLPMSGTSMATPMTAGTVALLLQANPKLTPAQVKAALTKTAKPLGGSVPNNNYGYGRVQAKAALDYVLSGQLPTPTPTPSPGVSPTPTATPTATPTVTPTPQPGGYAVSLMSMFASYNSRYGLMNQFQVVPGTTLDQGIMLANSGSAADSYTISVSGIPQSWYTVSGYSGGQVSPNTATSLSVHLTPAADTVTGAYSFSVTATSNSDSSVTRTVKYSLNVKSTAATPAPTSTPTPTPTSTPRPTVNPSPTVTPTATPVPPAGSTFSGSAARSQDYYVYVTPTQAGQVTAQVSWQSQIDDVNIYLYDPSGKLVASSTGRYTTSEKLQYNAPQGGYYLLKVSAPISFRAVSFTGTASPQVSRAYIKAGTVNGGQPVTYTINSDGNSNINARVAWSAYYKNIAVSLLNPSGQLVAQPQKQADSIISSFEQVNFNPSASGPYALKLEAGGLRDSIAYTLITPYQV
jgi:serine protease AprX